MHTSERHTFKKKQTESIINVTANDKYLTTHAEENCWDIILSCFWLIGRRH